MTIENDQHGTYSITAKILSDVKTGNWYYGFACIECTKPIALFEDISHGTQPIQFVGAVGGVLRVACPHCQADRLYMPDQVIGFSSALLH